MVKMQKYLFDTDFAAPKVNVVEMGTEEMEPEEIVQAEPEPPPPPTFSEEELALARDQAFEAGRQQGLQEAAASLQQMLGMAMATCAHHLQSLNLAQTAANEALGKDAVAIGLATVRKLAPAFAKSHGLAEVEAALADAMGNLDRVARITVKVNPDLVEAVKEKGEALVVDTGFEGKLVVTGDAHMAPGDCRVEWGEGGVERDAARTWADIDKAVETALGKLEIPSRDKE